MKRMSKIVVLLISVFAFAIGVNATEKNEVSLKFDGASIHDGYVLYEGVGKIQLFKGDSLVIDIDDGMLIDLNDGEYKLVIEEIASSGKPSGNMPIKLNINNWYYPMTTVVGESKSTFNLNSEDFSGELVIRLYRTITAINTLVRDNYTDVITNGTIDLTDGKEYVIDFTKTDELTEGLKTFADLDKTLYYQVFNGSLLVTNDESVAVIKIAGNREENQAILTAVNVGTKKSEVFKGLHTKYTGSKLTYTGIENDIINEIRDDYYTRNRYEYTFIYENEVVEEKEYEFLEGEGLTYNKDKSTEARFRVDAEYSVFENGGKVYVDGNLLASENYTSKSGSTIVMLKSSYLNTLSIGEHTLKIAFSDGKEVTTKFSVTEEEKEEEKPIVKPGEKTEEEQPSKTEEQPSKSEEIPKIENPETKDNIVIYGILGLVSLIGLIGSLIYVNKKNN